MIDYGKKAQSLGESEFFRPDTGRHAVTFLDSGQEDVSVFDEGTQKERVVNQLTYRIRVNNEEKRRSISEAISYSSLYGQIVLLGRYHGDLKDKTIHLNVMMSGKKRTYFVEEAQDLIKKAEEERKARQSGGQPQPASGESDNPFSKPFESKPPEPKKEEPQGSPSGEDESLVDQAFERVKSLC